MGVFSRLNLKGAKVGNSGGNYFTPGNYLAEVICIKGIERRGGKGVLFVMETKIVESDSEKHKVGSTANWVQDPSTDWGPGNIKECIIAVSGMDPHGEGVEDAEDWDAVLDVACDDKNPMAGSKVRVKCISKLKKNAEDVPSNRRDICSFMPA